eukprot:49788-Hanusia_phi.AAC.1
MDGRIGDVGHAAYRTRERAMAREGREEQEGKSKQSREGGVVRCGAVRCGAVRCGAVRCGA